MAHLPISRFRAMPSVRYVRAPEPIYFPEEAVAPEGKMHLLVRTFLFQLLRFALGPEHSVGSDQFVYWNARDPKRCLAPDVFVRLDVPDVSFGSWKTWERGGPPDLAIEIVSPNEGDGVAWDEKLTRYHELGVKELVRFEPEGADGARLRVWDRVNEDLVERAVENDRAPCMTLRLTWVVQAIVDVPAALRLLDADGELVLDELETKSAQIAVERRARLEAEARVLRLEEELRRRGG